MKKMKKYIINSHKDKTMFNNYVHSVEFSRNCTKRCLTYVDYKIHIIITVKSLLGSVNKVCTCIVQY